MVVALERWPGNHVFAKALRDGFFPTSGILGLGAGVRPLM